MWENLSVNDYVENAKKNMYVCVRVCADSHVLKIYLSINVKPQTNRLVNHFRGNDYEVSKFKKKTD